MSYKYYLINFRKKLREKQYLNENESEFSNNIFMSKASEIGKIIVNKCLNKCININTQKLHKLLVLVQIECIKDSGYPLFSDNIEVWDCGVIIKEVDKDFVKYAIQFNEYLEEKIVLLHKEIEYIDNVINQFGNLSSHELNNLCMNQKNIWCQKDDAIKLIKTYK